MASVVATPFIDENAKPQDNVPVLASTKPEQVSTPAPAEAPVPPVQAEPQAADEAEDEVLEDGADDVDEDEEYSEDEEEDDVEIEDIVDSDGDENYGEQSLEGFPLSPEEEARQAAELALEIGLGSTNEALAHVGGRSDQRVHSTITKYEEIIKQNQAEASEWYAGLTSEIISLRNAIDSGIHKIVSNLLISATPCAVECARSALENYLRVIVERCVVHCEYREQEEIAIQDLLVTLSVMGRPLYWGEQLVAAVPSETSALVEGQEAVEDEQDGDFVPMEEDEQEEDVSSDEDEEMETWDGKEEADEEVTCFDKPSFRRLVDVLNRANRVCIAEEVYTGLQVTSEDFLSQLFATAAKAVEYAGRREVEANDVRFAQSLVKL